MINILVDHIPNNVKFVIYIKENNAHSHYKDEAGVEIKDLDRILNNSRIYHSKEILKNTDKGTVYKYSIVPVSYYTYKYNTVFNQYDRLKLSRSKDIITCRLQDLIFMLKKCVIEDDLLIIQKNDDSAVYVHGKLFKSKVNTSVDITINDKTVEVI